MTLFSVDNYNAVLYFPENTSDWYIQSKDSPVKPALCTLAQFRLSSHFK